MESYFNFQQQKYLPDLFKIQQGDVIKNTNKMKIIKYSFLISLILTFSNCTPDNDGEFGETINRSEQISGIWVLENVIQVDLDAEKKSFPEYATELDVTNAVSGMPFSDFSIQIENDGSLATTIGNSPMKYVVADGSGLWSWITNDEISLVNEKLGINASSGIETLINGETVNFYISTYSGITGNDSKLSLNYERLDANNNVVMRYNYILDKQ